MGGYSSFSSMQTICYHYLFKFMQRLQESGANFTLRQRLNRIYKKCMISDDLGANENYTILKIKHDLEALFELNHEKVEEEGEEEEKNGKVELLLQKLLSIKMRKGEILCKSYRFCHEK